MMNSEDSAKQAAAPKVAMDDDRGLSDKPVFAAVAVGFVLIGVGGWRAINATAYTPVVHFAALIACCGLGITLAAFGGRAAGTWRSWAVTGCAAIALLLFLLQFKLQPPALSTLRGELQGTQAFQQISMWASGPLFVTRRRIPSNFEFAVFADDVDHASTFSLDITNKAGADPQEFFVYCLPTSLLSQHFGEPQRLNLSLRRAEEAGVWHLTDGKMS